MGASKINPSYSEYGMGKNKQCNPDSDLEKLGITKSDIIKVVSDIQHKFSRDSFPAIFLESFLMLYKFWPDGYRLLLQSNFKIHVNYNTSTWPDACEKVGADPKKHPAFWVGIVSPPYICIDLSGYCIKYCTDADVTIIMLHELMHAISDLTADYYNKNSCVFYNDSDYYENKYDGLSDIINSHEQIKFGKRFPLLDDCLLSYNSRLKYASLTKMDSDRIKKYGLWRYYIGFNGLCDNVEEMLADALVFYAFPDGKKMLKKLDPELYKVIEKVAMPLIKEANLGLARKKMYKQRGERAQYH